MCIKWFDPALPTSSGLWLGLLSSHATLELLKYSLPLDLILVLSSETVCSPLVPTASRGVMHCRNFPYHTHTMLLSIPCTARLCLAMKSPLLPAWKAGSWCVWQHCSGTGSRTGQDDTFAVAVIKLHPLAQHPSAGSRPAATPAPAANALGREAYASTGPGSEGEPKTSQHWLPHRTRSTRGSDR